MIHAQVSRRENRCRRDLGLVVDTTRSIRKQNIPILKTALRRLLERFDISEGETRVSYQTFHRRPKIHIKFDDAANHNKTTILDRINKTTMRLRQPTRLDLALWAANRKMFTEGSGMRSGIPKVVVLYTDGKTHRRTSHSDLYLDVMGLKEKGVRVIVVGIGPNSKIEQHNEVLKTIGQNLTLWVEDGYANLDAHNDEIYDLICPLNPCETAKGVDLAILLDRTKSITGADYMEAKGFVKQLVQSLNISRDATHLGLILFAGEAKVLFTFGDEEFHSNEACVNRINRISRRRFMPTRTDRALEAANFLLFVPEAGDRPANPNVLIILTDGKTHPTSKPFPQIVPLLKAKKVHIVVVGVGGHDRFQGQLEEIADPRNVHTVDNMDELTDIFDRIRDESCSVDGGLSNWGYWSPCSATCNGGRRSRTRTCDQPLPSFPYGLNCEGPLVETEACNNISCPKH